MSANTKTVNIEYLPDHNNALLMTWATRPVTEDITDAFNIIQDHLNTNLAPIDIIVDIQSNPNFPINSTINHAMKINSHPQLSRWLVIGDNRNAKFIGKMVSSFGKRNIHWFSTQEDALQSLN